MKSSPDAEIRRFAGTGIGVGSGTGGGGGGAGASEGATGVSIPSSPSPQAPTRRADEKNRASPKMQPLRMASLPTADRSISHLPAALRS